MLMASCLFLLYNIRYGLLVHLRGVVGDRIISLPTESVVSVGSKLATS